MVKLGIVLVYFSSFREVEPSERGSWVIETGKESNCSLVQVIDPEFLAPFLLIYDHCLGLRNIKFSSA